MLYSNTEQFNGSSHLPALDINTPQVSADQLSLLDQIHKLEELLIMEGAKVPFTGRKLINEEDILAQLEQIEQSFPQSVKTAQMIIERQDQIIAQAKKQAQDIIKGAEQRAAHIADELRIRQQAELEAQKIRQQVQQEVDMMRKRVMDEVNALRQNSEKEVSQLRQVTRAECHERQVEADRYADRVLSEMERQFNEMLMVIKNGRQHLKPRSSAQPPQGKSGPYHS